MDGAGKLVFEGDFGFYQLAEALDEYRDDVAKISNHVFDVLVEIIKANRRGGDLYSGGTDSVELCFEKAGDHVTKFFDAIVDFLVRSLGVKTELFKQFSAHATLSFYGQITYGGGIFFNADKGGDGSFRGLDF